MWKVMGLLCKQLILLDLCVQLGLCNPWRMQRFANKKSHFTFLDYFAKCVILDVSNLSAKPQIWDSLRLLVRYVGLQVTRDPYCLKLFFSSRK